MVHHKTYTDEIEVKVSAKRLWKALIIDSHNFLPKCFPDKIASVEWEGDIKEVGAIRTIKLHKEHHHHGFAHVKEKVEEIDHEKLRVKFSLIEGGLGAIFRHVKVEFEFKEKGDGCAIASAKYEYEAVGEIHEIPEDAKKGSRDLVKNAEAYLLAHNDYA